MNRVICFILTVLILFAGNNAFAYKYKRRANTNSLSPLGIVYLRTKTVAPQTTAIGIKASADFFNFTGNKELTTGSFSKAGLSAGIFVNIIASKHISLRHELNLGYGVFQQTSLGYINCTRLDVPWSVNYHFSRRNMVNVGIQPSIILNSRAEGISEKKNAIQTIEPIQLAGFVGIELGLKNNLGLGVRMLGYVNKAEKSQQQNPFSTFLQIYLSYNISESTSYDKKLMSYGGRNRQQTKTRFRY